jgi:hypothetical protein
LAGLSARSRAGGRAVALVTCEQMPELMDEGVLLVDALRRIGVDALPAVWSDPDVDWTRFDLVVVRGTWDYVWRREEFLAWARATPNLHNDAEIHDRNTDKRYLLDLSRAGVPIVPTQFVAAGDPFSLPGGEIVVKPAVSMGGVDTHMFGPDQTRAASDQVAALNSEGRTAMIQPYRADIDESAETGMIYIRGDFSHAIRKGPMLRVPAGGVPAGGVPAGGVPAGGMPAPGKPVEGEPPPEIFEKFRPQVISTRTPSAEELEIAEAALDAVPAGRDRLLYARVDVVPGPSGPEVLELEATEPALHLQYGVGSADRFAAAIKDLVG